MHGMDREDSRSANRMRIGTFTENIRKAEDPMQGLEGVMSVRIFPNDYLFRSNNKIWQGVGAMHPLMVQSKCLLFGSPSGKNDEIETLSESCWVCIQDK